MKRHENLETGTVAGHSTAAMNGILRGTGSRLGQKYGARGLEKAVSLSQAAGPGSNRQRYRARDTKRDRQIGQSRNIGEKGHL